MTPVFEQISRLRGGKAVCADRRNRNPYCVISCETDGSRTAYCFGTPVYHMQSRRFLDMTFEAHEDLLTAYGSHSRITLDGNAHIEGPGGWCELSLPDSKPCLSEDGTVRYGEDCVFAAANGIAVRAVCQAGEARTWRLRVSRSFLHVHANDRCFALMADTYQPFVTFSAIYAQDENGQVIAPMTLDYHKISDWEYDITARCGSPHVRFLFFEVNLYVPKLFADTTVESRNPDTNNAYGGSAFLGITADYGEQWLYTRLDLSKLSEFLDRSIIQVQLHIPAYCNRNATLRAYRITRRFCSFGSNWNNKIPAAASYADTKARGEYQTLDLTALITDPVTRLFRISDGFILKKQGKEGGFTAIATGDSYMTPWILEIRFR